MKAQFKRKFIPLMAILVMMAFIPSSAVGQALDTSNPAAARPLNPSSAPTSAPPPLLGTFPAPDGASRGATFDGTNLWTADSGDGNSANGQMVYKLNPATGAIINQTVRGSYPSGLAWDGTNLWHSDFGSGLIYKLNPATMAEITSFAAPGGFPFDLAYHNGVLYMVRGNTTTISKLNPATGAETGTITCNYAGASRPFGMTAVPKGPAGQLWVADDGNNTVNIFDLASNTWVDQWAYPGDYPCGMAYDSVSGKLWITDWGADLAYVFNIGGVNNYLLNQNLTYSGGTLTLDYDLSTADPATWEVWLYLNSSTVKIITLDLPGLLPVIPVNIPIPGFPSVGKIGFLSVMVNPGGVQVSDWDVVATGPPGP